MSSGHYTITMTNITPHFTHYPTFLSHAEFPRTLDFTTFPAPCVPYFTRAWIISKSLPSFAIFSNTIVSVAWLLYQNRAYSHTTVYPIMLKYVGEYSEGVKTLSTQDILAPSTWCWCVRTVRHQCSRTFRHSYQTVSTSSKHFLLQ